MRILILLATITFSFHSMAVNDLNAEICSVFADEYSGEQTEWSNEANDDVTVSYLYDDVYNYCMDIIEPEIKTGPVGSYYEFEIFICGGTYQDATMGYDPNTKILEDLAGSGSGDYCPYASEE